MSRALASFGGRDRVSALSRLTKADRAIAPLWLRSLRVYVIVCGLTFFSSCGVRSAGTWEGTLTPTGREGQTAVLVLQKNGSGSLRLGRYPFPLSLRSYAESNGNTTFNAVNNHATLGAYELNSSCKSADEDKLDCGITIVGTPTNPSLEPFRSDGTMVLRKK